MKDVLVFISCILLIIQLMFQAFCYLSYLTFETTLWDRYIYEIYAYTYITYKETKNWKVKTVS